MKTFPKPLSTKEEQEYLQRWFEGDSEAREVLIERNLRLVAHIAKKYDSAEKDIEDIISVGTIGLIKGIDSFKVDKNIRLATYASRCIENEILMLFRSEKKLFREVYIQEAIGTDNSGNEISLIDVIESEDIDVTDKIELDDNIFKLFEYIDKALTEREKEIITLRYGIKGGKEVTQREIAKQYGISRSYVSRIEKRALEKLRRCFEEH